MKAFGKFLLSFLLYFICYFVLETFIDRGIVDQFMVGSEDTPGHKILNEYWVYYSIKNVICVVCSIIISIEILKFSNKTKAYYRLIGVLSLVIIVYVSVVSIYYKFEVDTKYLISIILGYVGAGIYFHKHLLSKKQKPGKEAVDLVESC